MKGTLTKTEQGWVVRHSRLNDDGEQIGFGRYEELSLHPEDVLDVEQHIEATSISHSLNANMEVDFNIVYVYVQPPDDMHSNRGADIPHAKLINVDKLGNEDVPKLGYDEKGKPLTYWGGKQSDISKMVEDDVEKLELNYYRELEERREVAKNFKGQVAGRHPDMFGHSEMHHMVRGYVEGYNKAKETLYTEEQVMEAIDMARNGMSRQTAYTIISTSDEIIQSLKQPKK